MADEKLTDKDTITVIDDLDLLHFVDVSDTTSDPDGTSKKGLFSLLKSTLKTYFDSFYLLISNFLEENIVGTASEDLTLTGAENISLDTNTDMYLKLTGNTTITFTDTPSVGNSIVRSYAVESTATETLGIANSTDEFGTYSADGTINEMIVKASNYTTEGLIIRVFFSQPN